MTADCSVCFPDCNWTLSKSLVPKWSTGVLWLAHTGHMVYPSMLGQMFCTGDKETAYLMSIACIQGDAYSKVITDHKYWMSIVEPLDGYSRDTGLIIPEMFPFVTHEVKEHIFTNEPECLCINQARFYRYDIFLSLPVCQIVFSNNLPVLFFFHSQMSCDFSKWK